MNHSQRNVPFERVHNFRDLGGYAGADQRKVIWGALFRSAQLSDMTESDKALFGQLGVELVCDFRRDDERELQPTPVDPVVTELISLAISPGSSDSVWGQLGQGKGTAAEMSLLMEAINRDLILAQAASYRQLFDLMLRSRRRVLIHCAAGKDRTGVAAALILSALGVDRDTIMEDYLLTNHYLPVDLQLERLFARFAKTGVMPSADVLRPVLEARESYLAAAFAAIDEHFGSTDIYLRDQLGVGSQQLAQLQQWYLQ